MLSNFFRAAGLALGILLAAPAVLPIAAPAFAQLQQPAGEAMLLAVDAAPLVAETTSGERRFAIEIADDAEKRARGLMFRTDMPDDRGMLFLFPETRPVGFWMKNTPMPLDLVFVGEDGRVVAVLPGESFSEATISPGSPSRFVLELKRGTASATGIETGVRLRHPAIDAVAGND